jgi:imidazolonepropionase-like amidohydrolase
VIIPTNRFSKSEVIVIDQILTGVTLFYGEELEQREGQAVWVKDGLIYQILDAHQIPSDIPTTDCKGQYLFPGLIDLHVHVMWDGSKNPVATHEKESYEQMIIRAVANCQEYIRSGVTTIRDVGSIDDIALHVAEGIKRKLFVGPRLIACGKTLTMTGGHDPFWGRFCDGPVEAVKATREQIFKNAGVIKVSATGGVYGREQGESVEHSELSYGELKVICDEAHRFGLKVASHAIGREGILNSIRAGVDTIEHGHFLDEELISTMIEQQCAWIPTLYIYQQIAHLEGIPSYAQEKAEKIVKIHEEAFKRFFDSGVLVGAGSDAGSCNTPHPSVVEELITMHQFVSNTVEVLKTATSNAGKIVGQKVGQIREGYFADFILLRNNPLVDVQALKEVERVYLAGKQVY